MSIFGIISRWRQPFLAPLPSRGTIPHNPCNIPTRQNQPGAASRLTTTASKRFHTVQLLAKSASSRFALKNYEHRPPHPFLALAPQLLRHPMYKHPKVPGQPPLKVALWHPATASRALGIWEQAILLSTSRISCCSFYYCPQCVIYLL